MQHPHEFEDTMEKARPELSAAETAALWSRIAERTSTAASPVPSPYWLSIVQRTSMSPFIIALLLLVGAGGTVAASESARPGDLLFPIERAAERARLAMTSDEHKESLRSSYANKRLEEIHSIIGDVTESDDIDTHRIAVSAEGEVRISNAINALVDILEEIETDKERERVFTALIDKVETIEVKNRGTIQVQSDDDNNARIKIKDDRIELRDGSYRLRLNTNSDVIFHNNDDNAHDGRDDNDRRNDAHENRNDDDDSREGIDEIEVAVEDGVAKITLDYRTGHDVTYTISYTTEAAVIANIAAQTGLTEAAVAAIMEFKMDEHDDAADTRNDDNDADNDSRNDDNDDSDNRNGSTSLKELEVEVENAFAQVKIEYQNDREEKFSLPFVSETALVATIALKTGLSQTVISSALEVAYNE